MTETTDISAALEQTLPAIDRYLAERDTGLTDRPLAAAIEFVSHFVEAVQDKGAPAAAPGKLREYLAAPWFALLYGQVEDWYRRHYPGAMQQVRDDRIFGIAMIAGTVFAIRVPSVRRRPGRAGETVWIGFPDGLREGERALDWIDAPPNFAMLSPKEQRDAEDFATEVANSLRFIRTGLVAVKGDDGKLAGLKAGVMPRLRRAAELLLEPSPEPVQQAYTNVR